MIMYNGYWSIALLWLTAVCCRPVAILVRPAKLAVSSLGSCAASARNHGIRDIDPTVEAPSGQDARPRGSAHRRPLGYRNRHCGTANPAPHEMAAFALVLEVTPRLAEGAPIPCPIAGAGPW